MSPGQSGFFAGLPAFHYCRAGCKKPPALTALMLEAEIDDFSAGEHHILMFCKLFLYDRPRLGRAWRRGGAAPLAQPAEASWSKCETFKASEGGGTVYFFAEHSIQPARNIP